MPDIYDRIRGVYRSPSHEFALLPITGTDPDSQILHSKAALILRAGVSNLTNPLDSLPVQGGGTTFNKAGGYTITDLGTLPGYSGSSASGINNVGQIFGDSGDPFIYQNGVMTDLNTPSLNWHPHAINNSGQIVGTGNHAIMYSNGSFTDLTANGGNKPMIRAYGINDAGVVVGTDGYDGDVSVYNNGTTTEITTIPQPSFDSEKIGTGYAINNAGEILGFSLDAGTNFNSAFFYNGSPTYIPDLLGLDTGTSNSRPINDAGQFVGYSSINGYDHAVVYNSNAQRIDLGTLPGDINSYATGINNNGDIIGTSLDGNFNIHPFIYSNGVMTDLNTLIAGSGWTINSVNGINDKGQIVGDAINSLGQDHAFLADPLNSNAFNGTISVGNLTTKGQIILQGNAININGSSLASNGGDITFDGAAFFKNNSINIDSTANNQSGDLTFNSTIDGYSDMNITLNNGKIVVNGGIGISMPFKSFTIVSAKTVNVTGKIVTNNDINLTAKDNINASNLQSLNGAINLTSTQGAIKLDQGNSASHDIVTSGGNVDVNAAKEIVTDNVLTSGITGGHIALTSSTAKINVGYLKSDGSSIGGNINVTADKDVITNHVISGGGNIDITSNTGDITTDYLRSDGNTTDGNIHVKATSGIFKAKGSTSINGLTDKYSIYTGQSGNGSVTIERKSDPTGDYFSVGDSKYNGTDGAVSSGSKTLLPTTIVVGSYIDGNMKIITPNGVTGGNNTYTPPPPSPVTYTTTPPAGEGNYPAYIDNKLHHSGTITNQDVEDAVLAIDNMRQEQFFTSQGQQVKWKDFSGTNPGANFVNAIQQFINNGDSQSLSTPMPTKSAVLYTYLTNNNQLDLILILSSGNPIYKSVDLTTTIFQNQQGLIDHFTGNSGYNSYFYRIGVLKQDPKNYQQLSALGKALYNATIGQVEQSLKTSNINNIIIDMDTQLRRPIFPNFIDNNSQYLVENYSTSYMPAFQSIRTDNYYSLKSANTLLMGASKFNFNSPLPGARGELEMIGALQGNAQPSSHLVYLNQQFSLPNFQNKINNLTVPIVSISTHGSSDSLILGSTNVSSQDKLNYNDLGQLNLSKVQLFYIDGCDTSAWSNQEPYFGLTGTAIVAGAKSAIGGDWVTGDSDDMLLANGFYQNLLKEGLTKTKALQQIQIAMLTGNATITRDQSNQNQAQLHIPDLNNSTTLTISIPTDTIAKIPQDNLPAGIPVGQNFLNSPFDWGGIVLTGNPW